MLLGDDILGAKVSVEDESLFRRGRGVVERIRPWGPDAGAWRRVRGVRQAWNPRVDLAFVEELAAADGDARGVWDERRRRIRAAQFLVERWPAEVRDRVRRLPGAHWQLLQFVNRGGEPALQLLGSDAALAYLIATAGPCEGDLAELLARRRRDMLPLFSFPPTEQAVRLLQKVPAACVRDDLLAELREAAADQEKATWLSHLPRINSSLLAIARDRMLRDRFTPACIARLARAGKPLPQCDLAGRVRELAETAERERRILPVIRTLADIDHALRPPPPAPPPPRHRAHDDERIPAHFPPPPVPAIPGIEPIETRAALRQEGSIMHHCVGGPLYARQIARGTLYAYRMTAPEPLTITVRRVGRSWRISEVQGPCNRPPKSSSLALIRQWLGEPKPEPVSIPAVRLPAPPPVFGAVARRRVRRPVNDAQLSFDFAAG